MATVLIIDDEAPIRKMLKKLLEKNGYDTLDAPDGRKGVELFNRNHPDLVITDLIMPEKEGLELIREIKKTDPETPVIAISGGGIADPKIYLSLSEKLGAVRSFSKPIKNSVLVEAVKEILEC